MTNVVYVLVLLEIQDGDSHHLLGYISDPSEDICMKFGVDKNISHIWVKTGPKQHFSQFKIMAAIFWEKHMMVYI